MFLVRVKLGRVLFHTEQTQANLDTSSEGRQFDTVAAAFNHRLREFLVFNSKRLYPEFMIVYERQEYDDGHIP